MITDYTNPMWCLQNIDHKISTKYLCEDRFLIVFWCHRTSTLIYFKISVSYQESLMFNLRFKSQELWMQKQTGKRPGVRWGFVWPKQHGVRKTNTTVIWTEAWMLGIAKKNHLLVLLLQYTKAFWNGRFWEVSRVVNLLIDSTFVLQPWPTLFTAYFSPPLQHNG